jgi:hypothetical protein
VGTNAHALGLGCAVHVSSPRVSFPKARFFFAPHTLPGRPVWTACVFPFLALETAASDARLGVRSGRTISFSRCFPRIDVGEAPIRESADVTCGDSRSSSKRNRGDQGVEALDRLADPAGVTA